MRDREKSKALQNFVRDIKNILSVIFFILSVLLLLLLLNHHAAGAEEADVHVPLSCGAAAGKKNEGDGRGVEANVLQIFV